LSVNEDEFDVKEFFTPLAYASMIHSTSEGCDLVMRVDLNGALMVSKFCHA
jgi:hypothetical protein